MSTSFLVVLFLALSSVPETADWMTIDAAGDKIKITLERSADGWRVFGKAEGPAMFANRRGDRLLVSNQKDAHRVAAYLAALDETGCDVCEQSPMRGEKQTCDVHGEVPGHWIDVAQVLEKPEDGWPRAGELRFRGDNGKVEFKAAEGGDGLDIDITIVIRATADNPEREIRETSRVRWSKAEE